MNGLGFASAGLVLCALNLSGVEGVSEFLVTTLLCLVLLVKIPSFPFSVWLPEAHVEATWPGSVILAGYSMKFASLATLSFVVASVSSNDFILGCCLLSTLVAAFGMATTVDVKKSVAFFSVLHMSLSFIALSNTSEFLSVGSLSWHHHSLVTSSLFVIVGLSYVTSASRLSRLLFSNGQLKAVLSIVLLAMASMSCDLPWSVNSTIELVGVRALGDGKVYLLSAFVVSFLVMIVTVMKLLHSWSPRPFDSYGDPRVSHNAQAVLILAICSLLFVIL